MQLQFRGETLTIADGRDIPRRGAADEQGHQQRGAPPLINRHLQLYLSPLVYPRTHPLP